MEAQYLRPKQAAAYLNISLSGLWLFIKQGKLKGRKLSERCTVIAKSDLDAFAGGAI